MKKRSIYTSVIGVFLVLLTCFFAANTLFVYAQSNELPGFDFLKKFVELANKYNSTNCPDSLKDQTGKCLDFNQIAQRCWIEDKKDKYGDYDPACCRINDQCPTGQTCSIGNTWCKSGFSCNPNAAPTTSPQSPTSPSQGGSPSGKYKTTLDNFTYYCQDDNDWRNDYGLDQGGCGPTSGAMLMSHFGDVIKPQDMAQIFLDHKFQTVAGGNSNMAAFAIWLQGKNYIMGPNLVSGSINIARAQEHIQDGYLIIAGTANFPCGGGCSGTYAGHILPGHVMVIDAVNTQNNTVRVRDPSNCIYLSNASNNGYEVVEDRFLWRPASQINLYAIPLKK